jgi:ectoine hydroxylase-related dioxygenase (phytanoyl-CoA dioxygenase family)
MKFYNDIDETEVQQHIKEIDYSGYTKVENFLSIEGKDHLLSLINKRYKKINELASGDKMKYPGLTSRNENDKIICSLYHIDYCFIDLLSSDPIRKIAMPKLNDEYYRFLPQHLPNYILSYYNARSSGNKLDMHIDSNILFLSDQKTNVIQVALLLEDSTIDIGCKVVVLGSQNLGRYTDKEFCNTKPLSRKAGDLIIWDSRLWHGTLANKTRESRWALIATLSKWWCKQSIDIVRNLDNDIYQLCSDEQKQLLRFCSIPPKDEFQRNNTKTGYDFFKKNVDDYEYLLL